MWDIWQNPPWNATARRKNCLFPVIKVMVHGYFTWKLPQGMELQARKEEVSVCVTGHRIMKYVQIMRWWSSTLRQWPRWNLGSIDVLNTLFYPAQPTCLICFCIFPFHTLSYSPPLPVAVFCCHTSLFYPLLTSSPGMVCRPLGRCPHLPPTIFRCLSLHLTLHGFSHCIYSICSPPPLPPSGCTQVPVGPLGLPHIGYLRASMPLPLLLCVCSYSLHLLVVGICFRMYISCKEKGPVW